MSPILTLMAYVQTRIARSDEDGVVAVEYVVLAAAILVAIAAAFLVFRPALVAAYDALL